MQHSKWKVFLLSKVHARMLHRNSFNQIQQKQTTKICRLNQRKMKGQVEVISKSLVRASMAEREDHNNGVSTPSKIDLTPWDLKGLMLDYIQKGLIFLKPTIQQHQQMFIENSNLIDHLKSSLSSALRFFPPLAGRLALVVNEDKTTSVFIDCNNLGAEFVVAEASDMTLAQILDPLIVPRLVHSFFPLNRVFNFEGTSKPLLGVQVTELADGYFIGCSMNHTAADASSFWHFFNSWSEISRGCRNLSVVPFLDPWFPESVERPLRLPYDLEKEMASENFIPEPYEERVLHLSRESIARLKKIANSEMGTTSISSLQSYMALLWRAVTRARGVGANEEVMIYVPIGTRWRMKPPLPEGYWGNAIHSSVVRARAGDLRERGLGWAAWQIHEAVAKQGHEQAIEFYENWVRSPVIAKKSKVFCNNFLGIASSPRNNVYGVDFGWGKPIAVRCGLDNKSDGKFSLFPGIKEGSIDIEVCLLPRTLQDLGKDQEFMEFFAN